jgi:glucosyl-3-phosphoglycerate synthase
MWRGLSVLEGELVCFLDGDLEQFSAHYAIGLLGPLIEFEQVEFVKGFYRRAFRVGEVTLADGGGRVNHLLARPALAIFYPRLVGVRQPLAGEIAARRTLLERLPFTTGYGIEIAMLLDVLEAVGLEGMAQVDLDVHHNRHQPLLALSAMAYEVLAVIATAKGASSTSIPRRFRVPTATSARHLSNDRRCSACGDRSLLPRSRRHAARPGRVAPARWRRPRVAAWSARDRGVPASRRRDRADVRPPPRAGR